MKVVIVGAGAAGLMAAKTLVGGGAEVVLLEKRNRIGGRIHTFTPSGFTNQVEAGAEFIHGQLPLTLKLLKKAKISVNKVDGEMLRPGNGKIGNGIGDASGWREFFEAMNALREDCTVGKLLAAKFSSKKYEKLRGDIATMAQGLDLADVSKLSTFSVRNEWAADETQFRPVGGYGNLMEWLRNECGAGKFDVFFNSEVQKIAWRKSAATAITQVGDISADAVLITVSVGDFQNNKIAFFPSIVPTLSLFDAIGFGEVIKIALEFKHAFWEEKHPNLGFLFAADGFTFWTQLAQHSPLLTAWLGNDYAANYDGVDDDVIIERALKHLSDAFSCQERKMSGLLKCSAVFRYTKASDSGGGYSWRMPESEKAIRKINKGIDDTIWFAGEALHLGKGAATVEAALQSGQAAAKRILKVQTLRNAI